MHSKVVGTPTIMAAAWKIVTPVLTLMFWTLMSDWICLSVHGSLLKPLSIPNDDVIELVIQEEIAIKFQISTCSIELIDLKQFSLRNVPSCIILHFIKLELPNEQGSIVNNLIEQVLNSDSFHYWYARQDWRPVGKLSGFKLYYYYDWYLSVTSPL